MIKRGRKKVDEKSEKKKKTEKRKRDKNRTENNDNRGIKRKENKEQV